MDDDRSREPLRHPNAQSPRVGDPGDAALEREIEAALAVTPSPEFLARVRMRIATEREQSAWRLPWTFAAVGTGVAVVAIVLVIFRATPGPLPESTSSSRAPVPIAEPPASLPPAGLSRGATTGVDRGTTLGSGGARPVPTVRRVVAGHVKKTSEPEVLISPAESAALRTLIAAIREGRVDLSRVPEAPSATTPLETPDEISFQPIEFAPLTVDVVDEGEAQ